MVANGCDISQRPDRVLEVIEKAVTEHDVEPAQGSRIVDLDIEDATVKVRVELMKPLDVLRPCVGTHNRAAALHEELGEVARPASDVEHAPGFDGQPQRS